MKTQLTALSSSDPAPNILIVGVGRSGTSLLQSMLASHPEISFPPEINFIRRFLGKGVLPKRYQSMGIQGFVRWLFQDNWFSRLKIDYANVIPQSLTSDGKLSEAYFYSNILREYSNTQNKKFCGDKDPRSIEFLPLIHHYFPKTQIIHIVRDPRDVLVSKKKAAWSKNSPSIRHIFANGFQFLYGHHMGKKLFKSRYHLIRYEHLLQQPEKVLNDLCTAIGIAYSSEMLNFQQAAGKIITESEKTWKKETLGPLLKTNSNKWRNHLNDSEVYLTERFCSRTFEIGGYSYSSVKKSESRLWENSYLKYVLLRVLAPIYQQYLRFSLLKRLI